MMLRALKKSEWELLVIFSYWTSLVLRIRQKTYLKRQSPEFIFKKYPVWLKTKVLAANFLYLKLSFVLLWLVFLAPYAFFVFVRPSFAVLLWLIISLRPVSEKNRNNIFSNTFIFNHLPISFVPLRSFDYFLRE